MEGASVVYCDGKKWNGTAPECHVPPDTPILSLAVDGSTVENPSVSLGENLSLSCHGEGGNPTPSLALYIGGEIVEQSTDSTIQYSTTVQTVHDSVQVYCTAANTRTSTPVQ